MTNPWKKISSTVIYKNNWLRLREDRVVTPAGSQGTYSYVELPPALAIVALTDDLHTFLVGQYLYPLQKYSWEVPEGSGKRDESTEDAARRELL